MSRAGAQARRDYGAVAREYEERFAEVYPFPPPGERRTVRITGQASPARRRTSRRPARMSGRPDRLALWAVLLGLVMIAIAAATARGEQPQHPPAAPPHAAQTR